MGVLYFRKKQFLYFRKSQASQAHGRKWSTSIDVNGRKWMCMDVNGRKWG